MNIDSRIPLRVSNKKAFVWNVDDIATIRSQHRICGTLTGTLPHLSQQNVFLGIPLILMPEEVVLLVEKRLAVLIDDQQAHAEPSIPELQQWESQRKETIQRQVALSDAKNPKEDVLSSWAMTDAAIQKRKEREQKKISDAAKVADIAAASDNRTQVFVPNTTNPSTPSYAVVTPASSSSFEWYHPQRSTYETIASAKAAGIWEYPSNLQERARCGVFRALWEQGYFMGGGVKFGGDYLVYPGDPLRYHSHFTASTLESPTFALRPMEIVAHGRLGTATKKSHLLCGWDDEKQEVSYLSIEWAGFG